MENWKFRIKERGMFRCGTPLALYSNRHGMVCGESPLPIKHMHRQGGGRAEFGKNILERKTPQSSGGGPESWPCAKKDSKRFGCRLKLKIERRLQNNSLAGSELKLIVNL